MCFFCFGNRKYIINCWLDFTVIKKTYGISPKQYIIDTRMNMAKQMLSEGSFKINAISEKCGFTNPYHFCRLFKEKTGLTPTEYMKQNKFNIL